MIDRFFRPFVGGIQLDPTLSTSNRMFDVVLQQLFRADAVVPAKGMGEIPAQLASRLPAGTIHLDTPVTAVSSGSVTTDRGTVNATDVIVAVEGPAAVELLDLPPVDSNPATCVWFAADAPPITEPLLVLDGEGPARNIAVMSNVSPAYAPAGKALIGGACPGMLDPDAEPAVRAQLRDIWGPRSTAGSISAPTPSPTASPHSRRRFPQNSGRRWATDSTSAATIATPRRSKGPVLRSPLRRNDPRRLIRSRWVRRRAATTLAFVRHTTEQLDIWRRDGGVILDSFFTADELAPCVDGMEQMYGHLRPDDPAAHENFDAKTRYAAQFANTTDLPFHATPELNLIGLHPALVACARAALGTDDVRMYQCHTGPSSPARPTSISRFTATTRTTPDGAGRGRSRSHDQLHDLSHRRHRRARAIHYVPVPESDPITARCAPSSQVRQPLRSAAAGDRAERRCARRVGLRLRHRRLPPGHQPHPPDAHRFTVTASYKAAGNDQIGWSAWPRFFREPWHLVMDNASVEQRTCLGIPAPGDPFWTELTLARTRDRWPNSDWSAYDRRSPPRRPTTPADSSTGSEARRHLRSPHGRCTDPDQARRRRAIVSTNDDPLNRMTLEYVDMFSEVSRTCRRRLDPLVRRDRRGHDELLRRHEPQATARGLEAGGQRRRLLRSTAGADQPHRDDGQTIGRHPLGHCLGGGIELPLGCTFRLAAEEGANIGLPEMDLGSTPAWGGSARLAKTVGRQHALDMILRAKTLTGPEALAIGSSMRSGRWPS